MTTNYARGRAFEYKTRDTLYEMGAVLVVRAAGSHTAADLVALFPHHRDLGAQVWLVQCKRDGRLPTPEKDLLLDIATETSCEPWVASQGERGKGVVLERLYKEVDYGG